MIFAAIFLLISSEQQDPLQNIADFSKLLSFGTVVQTFNCLLLLVCMWLNPLKCVASRRSPVEADLALEHRVPSYHSHFRRLRSPFTAFPGRQLIRLYLMVSAACLGQHARRHTAAIQLSHPHLVCHHRHSRPNSCHLHHRLVFLFLLVQTNFAHI